ncbi:unnamed protein product [Dovyalis caffra]|uniref:Uncharacterized protein n=1 Tax=Dovyalis caffra TaxID=77055 RepID=A0AAV1SS99_9ROSI|nr:unnamed protein product [Dovyalis caffra]
MVMELIPGLPYDIARDCLIRVRYKQLATVVSICKSWKSETESPEFRRLRKAAGTSQKLIVMVQARVDPNQTSNVVKYGVSPVFRLTLVEPDMRDWCELPPVPGFSNGLPLFCQVASVGSDLLVLGGLDPVTWEVSNSVFAFNLVSATWRRGADMPGHDGDKNALRSAMAYDVAKDKWVCLPDMARERDECKAIFQHGKLHVIGGYCTEMQGRFERTAEVFDLASWQWDDLLDDLLKVAMCPKTCVCGSDGMFYMCRGGDVVALREDTWQAVAKLPADVSNIAYVTAWQDKLVVIGTAGFGEPHMAYVLDLKNYKWKEIERPQQYSGHVQSGCYLEI